MNIINTVKTFVSKIIGGETVTNIELNAYIKWNIDRVIRVKRFKALYTKTPMVLSEYDLGVMERSTGLNIEDIFDYLEKVVGVESFDGGEVKFSIDPNYVWHKYGG